jgi:hypothetical protein
MTQLSSNRIPRRGRVFPERQLSPEEKAKYQAEDEAFAQRCRQIYDQIASNLMKSHYDWFIVIEPDSGDYFIDPNKTVAKQKAHEKYPDAMCLVKRLNETGCCGTI